ncbi:MAG: bifunctional adenosylcobinamide kinase/adenosylcobinamide-phosphate guanylyltransferase [Geminicoccaceae bacterium]|nr:bifunctional adenosylcobinamide kinase/adenosylcobinamide-phosphate guanylyltransferase [Geminicoccaceae bacterium]
MLRFRRTAFVIGGARSGKSRFAQELVEARPGRWVYLATADRRDDGEMLDRIAAHRAGRGERWRTVEEPLALADALLRAAGDEVVLVDCLTLWLSNLMERGRAVEDATRALADAIARSRAALVLVSNEVGQGIVPVNPLARRFRDDAGRLHQSVAAVVDDVFLVTAGLPLRLKPARDDD